MKYVRMLAISASVASLSLAGCDGSSHPGAMLTTQGTALPAAGSLNAALRHRSSGTFTEYPIPSHGQRKVKSYPIGITTGADGKLWFAVRGWGEADSITMDGAITPLSLKGNWRGPSFHPQNLAVDADGNLWATCGTNKTHHQQSNDAPDPYGSIRKVAPSGKIVKVARIPTMDSDPRSIVIAPSGDVWFSEARGAIGFVSGDAAPVEIASQGNNPVYPIVVGPDQNIWFGETFNDTICRVTLPYSPSESPTCFTLPAGAGPAAIVTGPGGYLYMTEFNAGKVAQVTTAGTIRAEAPLQQGSFPKGITFGSDGNLYVSEFGTGSIARISMVGSGSGTAFGAVTELAIPTSKSGPWGIVSGPDGNIWFTESLSGQIGKLTI